MGLNFVDKVIALLLKLNLDTPTTRQAFIFSAGLDQNLVDQIDFSGSSNPFVSLLVAQITRYGTLTDGRDAIVAVLEVAKGRIGIEGQKTCDALINEWRAFRRSPQASNNISEFDFEHMDEDYPDQVKILREALEMVFASESEVRQFCHENFTYVYRRLKETDRWDHIISQIIDYCKTRGEVKTLWELLKERNPQILNQLRKR